MDIILSSNSFNYLDNKCPICLEIFQSFNIVLMIVHQQSKSSNIQHKSEGHNTANKRMHIFHKECITRNNMPLFDNCPMDRDPIHKLREFKYSHLVALNIINYAHDYYLLIKHKPPAISVTDVANLNYCDRNGKTLLYCACQCADEQLITKLILCGADVNIADGNGFTPLMILCAHNNYEIIRKIIRKTHIVNVLNVNAEDHCNFTAIDYAIEHNSWPSMQILLDKFFHKLSEKNKISLHKAIENAQPNQEIKYYIKKELFKIPDTINSFSIETEVNKKAFDTQSNCVEILVNSNLRHPIPQAYQPKHLKSEIIKLIYQPKFKTTK